MFRPFNLTFFLLYLAWPLADEALTQNILDLVQQAGNYRQLKKVSLSSAQLYHFSMEYQFISDPNTTR